MGKRSLALLLALLLALALTGCGGGASGEPEDTAAEPTEETAEPTEEPEEEPEQTPGWQPGGDVSILVADRAGSLADITARVLAQYLEKYIGQLVNVENYPGAYTETNEAGEVVLQTCEGTLGWAELAGREPDGLTLGYIELPAFPNAQCRWPDLVSAESFTPVCTHTTRTAVIVARAGEERFASLADMVAYGKAQEVPLVAATDTEHGQLHVWTQLFAQQAEMPYTANHQGSVSTMLQCLRDGAADFAVVCVDDILERDEGLQVLGVFGTKRLERYPDAPTLGELGLYGDWLGCASCVMAPAGAPNEAVAFFEGAFREAMADQRYLAASTGITTDYMDAEDTAALMSQQLQIAQLAAGGLWPAPEPAQEEAAAEGPAPEA